MPHYICRIGVATLAFIWQHFITVNKLSSRVLYEERATQGDKRVTGLILMMEKVVTCEIKSSDIMLVHSGKTVSTLTEYVV